LVLKRRGAWIKAISKAAWIGPIKEIWRGTSLSQALAELPDTTAEALELRAMRFSATPHTSEMKAKQTG